MSNQDTKQELVRSVPPQQQPVKRPQPMQLGRPLTQDIIQQVMLLGPVFHRSRMYGTISDEAAMSIMLEGFQLGFNISSSFRFINVISGKPALNGQGILALIHRSNLIDCQILDQQDRNGNPMSCTVMMMRRDSGFSYAATFTMQDAMRAGLVKSQGAWEKWTADMLCWRAVARCARRVCPDLLGGLYIAYELDEETQDVPRIQVIDQELQSPDLPPADEADFAGAPSE